jgi:hypothetical protein
MTSKTKAPRLTLKKETVQRLTTRTGVQAGYLVTTTRTLSGQCNLPTANTCHP